MILITNKKRHPVQLVVRSTGAPRAFTTLNIPGIGAGNNIYELADERWTEYVERVEQMGWIKTKHVPNSRVNQTREK